MIRAICIFVLPTLIAAAPTTQPATQPDYFHMSPEDFWDQPEIDKPLDFLVPDDRLISAAIFHETNRCRVQEKLTPFEHLDQLDEAAKLHVQYMTQHDYVGHDEKDGKYPTVVDRVRAAGIKGSFVGENVALAFGIQYRRGATVIPLKDGGLSYRPNGQPLPPHTYRTFAQHTVKQWMDSPPHRANILAQHFRCMGSFAIPMREQPREIETEFHKFYCGQVFFTPTPTQAGKGPALEGPPEPPDDDPIGKQPADGPPRLVILTDEPTSKPVDYFALSAEEFAKLPAANRRLDLENPDQKLLSAAILHETNAYRAKEKLRPLQHMDELDEAAMIHARDMSHKGYLDHEQKDDPKLKDPIDRIRAVGLKPRVVGENIATTFGIQYEPGRKVFPLRQWSRSGLSYSEDGPAIPPHTYRSIAAALVKGWWNSPHHRENILLPDALYLGNACVPARPKTQSDQDFHKFYCAQEFFSPMRSR